MSAFDNDGGADAASAESARQALLLATRALGVNAAAVREERKRRCAEQQSGSSTGCLVYFSRKKTALTSCFRMLRMTTMIMCSDTLCRTAPT